MLKGEKLVFKLQYSNLIKGMEFMKKNNKLNISTILPSWPKKTEGNGMRILV